MEPVFKTDCCTKLNSMLVSMMCSILVVVIALTSASSIVDAVNIQQQKSNESNNDSVRGDINALKVINSNLMKVTPTFAVI